MLIRVLYSNGHLMAEVEVEGASADIQVVHTDGGNGALFHAYEDGAMGSIEIPNPGGDRRTRGTCYRDVDTDFGPAKSPENLTGGDVDISVNDEDLTGGREMEIHTGDDIRIKGVVGSEWTCDYPGTAVKPGGDKE